jgi:hypothetical protein
LIATTEGLTPAIISAKSANGLIGTFVISGGGLKLGLIGAGVLVTVTTGVVGSSVKISKPGKSHPATTRTRARITKKLLDDLIVIPLEFEGDYY